MVWLCPSPRPEVHVSKRRYIHSFHPRDPTPKQIIMVSPISSSFGLVYPTQKTLLHVLCLESDPWPVSLLTSLVLNITITLTELLRHTEVWVCSGTPSSESKGVRIDVPLLLKDPRFLKTPHSHLFTGFTVDPLQHW